MKRFCKAQIRTDLKKSFWIWWKGSKCIWEHEARSCVTSRQVSGKHINCPPQSTKWISSPTSLPPGSPRDPIEQIRLIPFIFFFVSGVCDPDEGAEPGQGESSGERGRNSGTEGREEQYEGECREEGAQDRATIRSACEIFPQAVESKRLRRLRASPLLYHYLVWLKVSTTLMPRSTLFTCSKLPSLPAPDLNKI